MLRTSRQRRQAGSVMRAEVMPVCIGMLIRMLTFDRHWVLMINTSVMWFGMWDLADNCCSCWGHRGRHIIYYAKYNFLLAFLTSAVSIFWGCVTWNRSGSSSIVNDGGRRWGSQRNHYINIYTCLHRNLQNNANQKVYISYVYRGRGGRQHHWRRWWDAGTYIHMSVVLYSTIRVDWCIYNRYIHEAPLVLPLLWFTFSFPCLHPSAYLCIPFTPLTVLSYSIHSTPHLLFHIHNPLLLHAPTCTPPMIVCLARCTTHGPLLTPVDLPSSLYYISLLVWRISLKLILLCTT